MAPEPRRFDELSPESYERALRRAASVAEASPPSVAPEDGDLVEEILNSEPGEIAKEVAAGSEEAPTHDGRHRAADW